MKIALMCSSPLLQHSLQVYLKGHIVSYELSQIVISDRRLNINKPLFLLGYSKNCDLVIPFSKSKLFSSLESFYVKLLEQGYEMEKEVFIG